MQTAQSHYEAEVLRQWAAGPADGAHDIGHLRRVWKTAQDIAATEPCDHDILCAACFFHDLINLPKSHPDRAHASGLSARAATDFLTAFGFPVTKLAAVAHAITAHSFSANIAPKTPEARILQDADRLEALGAIGLARMFHVAGSLGGGLFDPEDPMANNRPLDDRAYALDHLETKLLKLPALMQTKMGRKLASARADWLTTFRTQLLREIT